MSEKEQVASIAGGPKVERLHGKADPQIFQLSLPFLCVHGQIMSSSSVSGGQSGDHMKEGKW